jgi:16S rRNA (cytidine1402-2'-O)-methyltransferase
MLAQGKSVALVTDAGTPTISDPGATVVARTRASGFDVVPIPGPNAAIAALSAAGIADSPFLFAGFLPPKSTARRKALAAFGTPPCTLVLYEAPHRVVECVEDIAEELGAERTIVIARELTKLFEQIHRCPAGEASAWLQADPNRRRGEFVLIVPAPESAKEAGKTDWERVLAVLLDELPLAHAVKLACRLTGVKRKAAYERALQLAQRVKPRRR